MSFSTSVTSSDQTILRKGTSLASAGSLASDGTFAWARQDGGLVRLFAAVDATMLRWAGTDVIMTDNPVTFAADWSQTGTRAIWFDSPAAVTTVTVRADGVTAVDMDGSPIAFTVGSPGTCVFSLSTGGKITVTLGAAGVDETPGYAVPRTVTLEQNYPNPFNPSTMLRFTLPVQSWTRVRVYNSVGQCVRTLVDGELGSGLHQQAWDGRDDDGRDAASGVYVFEVATPLTAQRTKGILLR